MASRRAHRVAIRAALDDPPASKDILVATPEELAREGQIIGSTLHAALQEAELLHERAA